MSSSTRMRFALAAGAVIILGVVSACGAGRLERTESVIAGGPGDFVEVRHIVLRGSNFDIGRELAEIARKDGTKIEPKGDPLLNRAKREYIAKNYPILLERMKGIEEMTARETRLTGAIALKDRLRELAEGEFVSWHCEGIAGLAMPHDGVVEDIKAFCVDRGLKPLF